MEVDAHDLWLRGRFLMVGDRNGADWKSAEPLLEMAAKLDVAKGAGNYAFELGRIYLTGYYYSNAHDDEGVPKCPKVQVDYAKARHWFEQAAQVDFGPAIAWLALDDDEDLELSRALNLFEWDKDPWFENYEYPWNLAACDLGNVEACCYAVGNLEFRERYFRGTWPERDPYRFRRMIKPYRRAIELGASHLSIGNDPAFNAVDASCMQKEAMAGLLISQLEYGHHLAAREPDYFGRGGPDPIRAFAWLSTGLACDDEAALVQARTKNGFNRFWNVARSIVWFYQQVLAEDEIDRAKTIAQKYLTSSSARKIGPIRRFLFQNTRPWRI